MCTASVVKKLRLDTLFLIIILVFTIGCSKSMVISEQTHALEDGYPLQYTLSEAKHKKGRKLLIYIPDIIDTAHWAKSTLATYLFEENYQILQPQVRGADYSEQTMLDQYSTRIADIEALVASLHEDGTVDTANHLVILGMGDGAYITPKLTQRLQTDAFILVNNGPFSFIYEIETLLETDTAQAGINDLKERTLVNASELRTLLQEIRTQKPTMKTFLGRTTGSWTAYGELRAAEATYLSKSVGLQLMEPNYPFVADAALTRFKRFTAARYPTIDTLQLTTPLFTRKALPPALVEKLEVLLSTR
jgi:hypothetical protein